MWEWVNANLANVRCTHNRWFSVDQILHAVNCAFPQKNSSHFALALCPYPVSVSDFTDFFFQKPSQINKIVLKQVEENAKTK